MNEKHERRTAAEILDECEAKRGGATAGERELAFLLAADEGDAATLRGYIKTYGETPTMTASALASLRVRLTALADTFKLPDAPPIAEYTRGYNNGLANASKQIRETLQLPSADLREKLIEAIVPILRARVVKTWREFGDAVVDALFAEIAKGGGNI